MLYRPINCSSLTTSASDSPESCGATINEDLIHDIVVLEDALSASADIARGEHPQRLDFQAEGQLASMVGASLPRFDKLFYDVSLDEERVCPCSIRYVLLIISLATPDVPTAKPSLMGAGFAMLSPTTSKFSESPIVFNSPVVTRRDNDQEDKLEHTLCWASAVVEGPRSHSHFLV